MNYKLPAFEVRNQDLVLAKYRRVSKPNIHICSLWMLWTLQWSELINSCGKLHSIEGNCLTFAVWPLTVHQAIMIINR